MSIIEQIQKSVVKATPSILRKVQEFVAPKAGVVRPQDVLRGLGEALPDVLGTKRIEQRLTQSRREAQDFLRGGKGFQPQKELDVTKGVLQQKPIQDIIQGPLKTQAVFSLGKSTLPKFKKPNVIATPKETIPFGKSEFTVRAEKQALNKFGDKGLELFRKTEKGKSLNPKIINEVIRDARKQLIKQQRFTVADQLDRIDTSNINSFKELGDVLSNNISGIADDVAKQTVFNHFFTRFNNLAGFANDPEIIKQVIGKLFI